MLPQSKANYTEKDFTLDTPDGKKIYCIHYQSTANDKVIILSHGLTGRPEELIHQTAKRFFTSKGYDVISFYYYHFPKDARKLQDCTVEIHGKDLNTVCAFAKSKYKKVFVAGHSYGGLTILFARPAVTALSFWDSSYQPFEGFWKQEAEYIPALDCYKLLWSKEILVSTAMYEEAKNLSLEQANALAEKIETPSQVILAEISNENAKRNILYTALKCKKELTQIAGADHEFVKGDTVFSLLDATVKWFDKF